MCLNAALTLVLLPDGLKSEVKDDQLNDAVYDTFVATIALYKSLIAA
jgi:hypothetical protein